MPTYCHLWLRAHSLTFEGLKLFFFLFEHRAYFPFVLIWKPDAFRFWAKRSFFINFLDSKPIYFLFRAQSSLSTLLWYGVHFIFFMHRFLLCYFGPYICSYIWAILIWLLHIRPLVPNYIWAIATFIFLLLHYGPLIHNYLLVIISFHFDHNTFFFFFFLPKARTLFSWA